jgi:hypothetical protein
MVYKQLLQDFLSQLLARYGNHKMSIQHGQTGSTMYHSTVRKSDNAVPTTQVE